MRSSEIFPVFITLGAVLVLAVLLNPSLTTFAGEGSPSSGSEGPVVVELFTSQGCSSCPPADRLLTRLADADRSRIIPLAFHVDYWNYIGWTDPFSSEDWSDRQRRYARAFGSSRIYTPQLVVNGRAECVGSDRDEVLGHVREAGASRAAGEVVLDLTAAPDRLRLDVTTRVREVPARLRWDVMVAVFETDLVTPVKRGENGGRTLHNSNVVRELRRAFTIEGDGGAERSATLDVGLEPSWKRDKLGVAVFLQDPETLHIHGAAVRYLGANPSPA